MPERLIVAGGLVIDPARRLEAVRDVLIEDGRVTAVAAGLARKAAFKGAPVIDAKGRWACGDGQNKLVCAGLTSFFSSSSAAAGASPGRSAKIPISP